MGAVLFLELAVAAAHGDAGKVAVTSLSLLTITGITTQGHDVITLSSTTTVVGTCTTITVLPPPPLTSTVPSRTRVAHSVDESTVDVRKMTLRETSRLRFSEELRNKNLTEQEL